MSSRIGHFLLALPLSLIFFGNVSHAEDSVSATTPESNRPYRLTGTIVDYSGKELVLELANGTKRAIPFARVLSFQTKYTAEQIAGDGLLSQGKYAEALAKYDAAMAAETRPWAKRLIVAQQVSCHIGLDDPLRAARLFRILILADAETPYFDRIPLAWSPGEPPLAMVQQARDWLSPEQPAAASLMGASRLLLTGHGADATAALKRLVAGEDRRVARLAEAQLWRLRVIGATADELIQWQTTLDTWPADLLAGPAYVLGLALSRREKHDEAAIAFLHGPILATSNPALAAAGLIGAAEELLATGKKNEATAMLREVMEKFPVPTLQAEAEYRLKQLAKPQP